MAGRQRMLSQRMSKEFLLVAQGIEVEANCAAMNRSAGQFQEVLYCLIGGCPERNMIGAQDVAVKEALQSVLDVWHPFVKLLGMVEDAAGKVSVTSTSTTSKDSDNDADGNGTAQATSRSAVLPRSPVPLKALEAVLMGSLELLSTSNTVVNLMVASAEARGGRPGSGQRVDVAPRQRMLVQRICKEVYAVALGVQTATSLANLRNSWSTFDASHQGLMLGATWVGVPELSGKCTVRAMGDVTHEWELFKPLIARVLAERTVESSQAKAQELATQVANQSKPLVAAIMRAVDFYIGKAVDCEVVQPALSEWMRLLDLVSESGFMGQSASQLLAEIASDVDIPASQLELVAKVRAAEIDQRYLLQGDKAKGIPSPPSQEILNELNVLHGIWQSMQGMLLEAVSNKHVEPFVVHQIASASRQHFESVRRVAALFEEFIMDTNVSLNAPLVNIVEKQRLLPVKMAKEAFLVHFGEEPEENGATLNASRALFVETHWGLLQGTTLTNGDEWEGVRDVCLVQQMRSVSGLFHELETAAVAVAWAGEPRPERVKHLVSRIDEAMVTAAHSFAELPATPACEPINVSVGDWSGALQQIGTLRALTERAALHYLAQYRLLNGNVELASASEELNSTLVELRTAALSVAFGSGQRGVPAPLDQETMNSMWDLLGHWRAFEALLTDAARGTATANATTTTTASASGHAFAYTRTLEAGQRLLTAAETAMARTVARAEWAQDPANQDLLPLPVHRLDMASRQALLVQRMTKEALLGRGQQSQGPDIASSVFLFEQAHERLRQSIPPERSDLQAQWERVDVLWPPFKQQVQDLARGGDNVQSTLATLADFAGQLDAATALFALQDPLVLPATPVFPYQILVHVLTALAILGVVIAASWFSCRRDSTASSNSATATKLQVPGSGGEQPQWNAELP